MGELATDRHETVNSDKGIMRYCSVSLHLTYRML